MGFEEIKHTGDRALKVWGQDLETLYTEAARGLYALMEAVPVGAPLQAREFSCRGADKETQLVSFLEELIFFAELEHLVFDNFTLSWIPGEMDAKGEGSRLDSIQRIPKAVTFHGLEIQKIDPGYQVTIVFDV